MDAATPEAEMKRARDFGPRAQEYRGRVALAERDLDSRRRQVELLRGQPALDLVWFGATVAAFRWWLAAEPASRHPVLLVVGASTSGLRAELRELGIGLVIGPGDEIVAAVWAELGRGRRLAPDEMHGGRALPRPDDG